MRKMTVEFAARLLGPGRASASLHHVVDGLEYARLCNVSVDSAVGLALERQRGWMTRDHRPQQHSPSSSATAFYVDPAHGSDSASGNISSPFRTIHHAVEEVRRARVGDANRPNGSAATRGEVWLRAGTHFLFGCPLMLSAADSNLTIASYANETAVLSGGRLITPRWEASGLGDDAKQVAHLVAHGIDGNFTGLFLNGIRQIRARHPNANPERDLHPRVSVCTRDTRYRTAEMLSASS